MKVLVRNKNYKIRKKRAKISCPTCGSKLECTEEDIIRVPWTGKVAICCPVCDTSFYTDVSWEFK